MYTNIITEVDLGVGIITLNRPERHNAFDDALIAELSAAIDQMAVRVLVISSSGKSFCAGADLNWMKRAAGYSNEESLRDARALAEMLRKLAQCPKPTIARVQGPAYGGGVGLVACCDVAIATFDAEFSLTEVRLGLIPAVISPHVIAAIGERYARRYMLTAERFSAAEAYRIGLLHEMVSDEEALDEALGEIIIHFRHLFFLYQLHIHFELGGFSSQLFFVIVFRENKRKFFFVFLFHTDEIFFKAGNEVAFANSKRMVLAFSAFNFISIDQNIEINFNVIILFRPA